ncbi:MAG: hypothetical protein FE78DRAFT_156185 [Acidomyces sp. 'richmondensis']|nr:MAG: hypothetical protein FE78DRAFT_156185 [Acidomyces sp. 'richmondensis']
MYVSSKVADDTQITVNTTLLCVSLIISRLHYLLYGPFDPAESEELYTRFVGASLESILTVVILDIDVDLEFVFLLIALLAGKVWIWITQWRMESLGQQRHSQIRPYACVLAGLLLFLIFESSMVGYTLHAAKQTANTKLGIMFGFEYAVLSLSAISVGLSFFLLLEEAATSTREQLSTDFASGVITQLAIQASTESNSVGTAAGEWKGGWRCVSVLVVIIGNLAIKKLSVPLSYLLVCLVWYKRPIISSYIFVTSHSLITRLCDLLRYRDAVQEINRQCFDATAEQVAQANLCAICHERMLPWCDESAEERYITSGERATPEYSQASCRKQEHRSKRLPCGHVYHLGCLQKWVERQATCPQCRGPVSRRATDSGRVPRVTD